ncbi:ECF RNA polymerase sigma factor SigD [Stieleria magnilauensis]|uniref:ECF RNA polymerase sigma factor SigD n=1 Tax=Stieleria magnilauensis TaxID=2527963 RepID=A0ABX5XXK8_9BACT|nr:ECF RNA polymerase sigma factor SigD [Planctomycetes bacterium TBK1r]
MSTVSDSSVTSLLHRASAGERRAVERLLSKYRDRLNLMVKVRLDSRLAGRLDASDVVQDTLLRAAQRLSEFETSHVPFYVWLRQIARDRLSELYERHVTTKKRSVLQEQVWGLSQDSMARMTQLLGGTTGGLIDGAIKKEMLLRLDRALDQLPDQQREILVMRYLEHMKVAEIAVACGLSESAVKMRQLRGVERLRSLLRRDDSGSAASVRGT